MYFFVLFGGVCKKLYSIDTPAQDESFSGRSFQ